jgi:hypothetical protein
MEFGPIVVYKCPGCGNFIQQQTYSSWNNLGGRFYSDGYENAMMLDQTKEITKCENCETLFWLDKQSQFGEYDSNERKKFYRKTKIELENVDSANDCLDLDDYLKAIDANLYRNRAEEKYLRMQLWQSFNDRVRLAHIPDSPLDEKKIFHTAEDKERYETNCKKLIEILRAEWDERKGEYEDGEDNGKLKIAELYRNLGEFEKCETALKAIDDEYEEKKKNIIHRECARKHKWVVIFNPD